MFEAPRHHTVLMDSEPDLESWLRQQPLCFYAPWLLSCVVKLDLL